MKKMLFNVRADIWYASHPNARSKNCTTVLYLYVFHLIQRVFCALLIYVINLFGNNAIDICLHSFVLWHWKIAVGKLLSLYLSHLFLVISNSIKWLLKWTGINGWPWDGIRKLSWRGLGSLHINVCLLEWLCANWLRYLFLIKRWVERFGQWCFVVGHSV